MTDLVKVPAKSGVRPSPFTSTPAPKVSDMKMKASGSSTSLPSQSDWRAMATMSSTPSWLMSPVVRRCGIVSGGSTNGSVEL